MSSSLVCLTNVGKTYQQLDALKSVSMALNEGEVLGLFGHNGAGKTTMMKLILGIISPCRGEVEVMGTSPGNKSSWKIREKIGYLPENVSFYEHLTGLEVLTYFAKLKGLRGEDAKKQATVLLEQVGITHAMKRAVKTYSKGMRQRLGLAQAFIAEPKLLLLDEPTVGLDPIATKDFYATVDQLKSNGSSVILCSHVLPGVEQHIDRAMILSGGDLLAMGTLKELRLQANLPVVIKTTGVKDFIATNEEISAYLNPMAADILHIPEYKKLSVLKTLVEQNELSDIQIEEANLDQVYQHFLTDYKKKQNAMGTST
ncbi:MAG: ABC transporter ATP-binding protein [Pseudoalteromonas marina]